MNKKSIILFLTVVLLMSLMRVDSSASPVIEIAADTTKPIKLVKAKVYSIEMSGDQYRFIDSVLQLSHFKMGRTLTVDEADPIKQSLWSILAFFNQQKLAQDKK